MNNIGDYTTETTQIQSRKEGERVAGEITTEQYANSSQVKVSFGVSHDDWCLIQQSEIWKQLRKFLEVSESRGSQMSLIDRVTLLEKGSI